jgi:hypothetical protein
VLGVALADRHRRGRIITINRAAARLLNAAPELETSHYSQAVPELAP